ncbi:hypothetical protein CpipJ_CPIJ019926, partial [Culex quinquefasciatus]
VRSFVEPSFDRVYAFVVVAIVIFSFVHFDAKSATGHTSRARGLVKACSLFRTWCELLINTTQ